MRRTLQHNVFDVRMKKRPFKILFHQAVDPWKKDLLVVVGGSHEDVLKFLKKTKCYAWFIDWVKSKQKDFDGAKDANGFCLAHEDRGGGIIWIRDWDSDYEHSETLMHEILHFVHIVLIHQLRMADEFEAIAYTHAHLFRVIHNKIAKHYDTHSRKRGHRRAVRRKRK